MACWVAFGKPISKDSGNQEAILEILSREDKNITGFLLDEVLNQQDPEVQQFLIMTSILNRFCIPLCEAVVLETHPEMKSAPVWK